MLFPYIRDRTWDLQPHDWLLRRAVLHFAACGWYVWTRGYEGVQKQRGFGLGDVILVRPVCAPHHSQERQPAVAEQTCGQAYDVLVLQMKRVCGSAREQQKLRTLRVQVAHFLRDARIAFRDARRVYARGYCDIGGELQLLCGHGCLLDPSLDNTGGSAHKPSNSNKDGSDIGEENDWDETRHRQQSPNQQSRGGPLVTCLAGSDAVEAMYLSPTEWLHPHGLETSRFVTHGYQRFGIDAPDAAADAEHGDEDAEDWWRGGGVGEADSDEDDADHDVVAKYAPRIGQGNIGFQCQWNMFCVCVGVCVGVWVWVCVCVCVALYLSRPLSATTPHPPPSRML